jgi:uncharacterized protein DUF6545
MQLDGAFLVVAGLAAMAALAAAASMLRDTPLPRPQRGVSSVLLLVLGAACYALSDSALRYHDLGRQLRAPDRLLTDAVTMIATFAVLALLIMSGERWAEARRRVMHRLASLTACVAGMTLCAMVGSGQLGMLAYFTLYVAFFGTALVEILVLSCHLFGLARHHPLRRAGLLLIGAGGAAGAVALAGQTAWAVATAPHLLPPALPASRSCAGLVTPPQCAFTVALPGASLLFVSAGATLPVLGGAVVEAWRFWRHVRMLCVLGPLWERMRNTFPQIRLPEHGTRSRLDPAFRLYRRVIEIGDGRAMLRPYMRPEMSAAATAAAAQFGLRGDELRATVEAAEIVAALRARRAIGTCDSCGRDPPPPDHADAEVPDLPAEAAWLAKVARAYATSPIVYHLASHRQ